MGRRTSQPRRRAVDPHGDPRTALPGRVLRGGPVGYYPCAVVIAGVEYPCAIAEWTERQGVQVARLCYLGPDGEDRVTTVAAEQVNVQP